MPAEPIANLDAYVEAGGGEGLKLARDLPPERLVQELEASGLRGRGGAGFPTGTKWRTVIENASTVLAATVVVNGAEGEPGTFKDRAILGANPYQVIEGALIAARAVGAAGVVIALKATFSREVARVAAAVEEVEAAGWADGVALSVFEGPGEYLYGEETALLEVLDGRAPLPRIAPPFRRGITEVVTSPAAASSQSGQSAAVEMAGANAEAVAPPTLVDNVETLANVPAIVARGAAWFRSLGTEESPGTIVCTVTGSTRRHGVGEVAMGTPLRAVIEAVGGGLPEGRTVKAVMSGVANGFITADLLDTPVSYEAMASIGSGVGSGGFMVFDDSDDMVAVAAGASRFLAVESCGQCTPCKQDGLALSDLLARLCRSEAEAHEVAAIEDRVATVADESRCYLATQHQAVVGSLLERFRPEVDGHASGQIESTEPQLVAELVDIDGGHAAVDEQHLAKQPDWSFDPESSGKSPADNLGEHRAEVGPT